MTTQIILNKSRNIYPIGDFHDCIQLQKKIVKSSKYGEVNPQVANIIQFEKRCYIELLGFADSQSMTTEGINIANSPTHNFILIYDEETKLIQKNWNILYQNEIYQILRNPVQRYIGRRQYLTLKAKLQGDEDITFNKL